MVKKNIVDGMAEDIVRSHRGITLGYLDDGIEKIRREREERTRERFDETKRSLLDVFAREDNRFKEIKDGWFSSGYHYTVDGKFADKSYKGRTFVASRKNDRNQYGICAFGDSFITMDYASYGDGEVLLPKIRTVLFHVDINNFVRRGSLDTGRSLDELGEASFYREHIDQIQDKVERIEGFEEYVDKYRLRLQGGILINFEDIKEAHRKLYLSDFAKAVVLYHKMKNDIQKV